jgi:hypothetical protein
MTTFLDAVFSPMELEGTGVVMREPWGIYCRISHVRRRDGQVDTLGVERQEPPCRALVERMGGEVYRVYIDNDISAWTAGRDRTTR